jgi:hypothetical protein
MKFSQKYENIEKSVNLLFSVFFVFFASLHTNANTTPQTLHGSLFWGVAGGGQKKAKKTKKQASHKPPGVPKQ